MTECHYIMRSIKPVELAHLALLSLTKLLKKWQDYSFIKTLVLMLEYHLFNRVIPWSKLNGWLPA